jgi:hypothetical protein
MIDDLLLGFTAGTFAKTLLAPLERAKLLLMIGVSQRKAPVGTVSTTVTLRCRCLLLLTPAPVLVARVLCDSASGRPVEPQPHR